MRPDETDETEATATEGEPAPEPRRFRAWMARAAGKAGRAVVGRALVLWYAARDPDTPAAAKAVLWGGLAYLAEPIDAIPDLTPLLGYSDDMAVMGIALAAVTASIKQDHYDRASARTAALFGEAPADAPTGAPTGDPDGAPSGDAA